jgi:hypothetical protein
MFNKSVSYQCVADWFHKRWDHEGTLKKANLISLDKWKIENKLRYYKFVQNKMCIRIILNTTFLTRSMSGTKTSMPRKSGRIHSLENFPASM